MLPYIAIAIAIIAGLVLSLAASRPATFRIERSATMAATPDRIFPYLADFHRWEAWSPWEKLDPALQRTHSGAASGVGAVYEWLGNKKVGQGRMEITDASPPTRLRIQLDFLKPFEAHNITTFALTPSGSATSVSWVMEGTNTFMGKLMGMVLDMDKLIGKDFEAGLANLKAEVEGPPA